MTQRVWRIDSSWIIMEGMIVNKYCKIINYIIACSLVSTWCLSHRNCIIGIYLFRLLVFFSVYCHLCFGFYAITLLFDFGIHQLSFWFIRWSLIFIWLKDRDVFWGSCFTFHCLSLISILRVCSKEFNFWEIGFMYWLIDCLF